ncbi:MULTISPECIES: hypothetical protein [Mesorhizobium]|uniref:hypothetical protein n=1 Tax=Mesorhizobium TaxID=68287 RepID=UPI00138F6FA0|nr:MULTISPECIES: hypothetical protein [Mesorhizobium]
MVADIVAPVVVMITLQTPDGPHQVKLTKVNFHNHVYVREMKKQKTPPKRGFPGEAHVETRVQRGGLT